MGSVEPGLGSQAVGQLLKGLLGHFAKVIHVCIG